jgi:hypothetical protein
MKNEPLVRQKHIKKKKYEKWDIMKQNPLTTILWWFSGKMIDCPIICRRLPLPSGICAKALPESSSIMHLGPEEDLSDDHF